MDGFQKLLNEAKQAGIVNSESGMNSPTDISFDVPINIEFVALVVPTMG
jgi:hypothetical protein